MTSKLDTAGLVAREAHRIAVQVATSNKTGRVHALAYEPAKEAARIALQSKIEALTAQAAAPNMEPRAWECYWPGAGSVDSVTRIVKLKSQMESALDDGALIEPLYTASQLSAMQERLEKAERERDEAKADAYRSSLECVARQGELDKANDRANKNWQDFRDLRFDILGHGPMCRDCADFDGRCQGDGRPCNPDEAVREQLAVWKAAEARIAELEAGTAKAIEIAERNLGRQNEKLADIPAILRASLHQQDGGRDA